MGIDTVSFQERDAGHFCPSSQRMARQEFPFAGQAGYIDRKRAARFNVELAATGGRVVVEILPEPLQQVPDDIVIGCHGFPLPLNGDVAKQSEV